DFNGDGKTDLVEADAVTRVVGVGFGNGSGGFNCGVAIPVGFSLSSSLQSIAAGDFNGDGKLDLAVADFAGGVDVLLESAGNTPTGSYVTVQPVDTTTKTSPVILTFSSVNQAGNTTLTTSASGPALPPGFQLGSPASYQLTTTALYSG